MRILLVNHVGNFSGAENDLLALATRLQRDSWEFKLAAPAGGDLSDRFAAIDPNALPLPEFILRRQGGIHLLKLIARLVVWTAKLIMHIRRNHIRIIHANSLHATLGAAIAARVTRTPLVLHLHDIPQERRSNSLLIRAAVSSCSAIIVPSRAVRSRLEAEGTQASKIHVVHNSMYEPSDLLAHNGAPEVHTADSPNSLLLLHVGQIAEWKGQALFVESARSIHRRLPALSLRWRLAGDVVVGDSLVYKRELLDLVQDAQLEGVDIEWLGHRDDARTLLEACDVYVHTSILPDPLPTTVLEAMALACCIVAADCGGVPEFVTDEASGLLYRMADQDDLTETIERAILSAELRRRLRDHAASVMAAYDYEANLQRLVDAYKSVDA